MCTLQIQQLLENGTIMWLYVYIAVSPGQQPLNMQAPPQADNEHHDMPLHANI